MAGLDALVTATIYSPAPVQAEMSPEGSFLKPPLTNPFNIAQLPAMSVCNGFSADGLPLGMQVVCAPFQEAMVMRIAGAYEQATPWRSQRPPLRQAPEREPPQRLFPPTTDLDPRVVDRCRRAAAASGLRLDDDQLAGLCHALPHVERAMARLPRGRDYDDCPALCFRHP
jgi:aspartyl-tRNA(Asn)/glutamyl-tRNA(Gln) amidotransferase subunit A